MGKEPVGDVRFNAGEYASLAEQDKRRVIKSILKDPESHPLVGDEFNKLPRATRQEVQEGSGGVLGGIQVSGQASDAIMLIVVIAMALIVIGTGVTLALGYFFPPNPTSSNEAAHVKPELLLAIFNSAIAFVGGLFVPSPIKKGQAGSAGSTKKG